MLRRLLLALIVAGLVLAVHRSVVSGHRIRVHDVCGIPAWNYAPETLTPAQVGTAFPVIVAAATTPATSTVPAPAAPVPTVPVPAVAVPVPTAVPVPAIPNLPGTSILALTPTTPVMRSYQLQQSALSYQQCTIQHVVVTLEQGLVGIRATVSYLGTQNPALADSKLQAQLSVIKRNRFHVRVLALSSATPTPAAAADPTAKVGATVLFTLETEPQWFERGETRFVQLQCPERPDLKPYFDLVDRLEVEFRYE